MPSTAYPWSTAARHWAALDALDALHALDDAVDHDSPIARAIPSLVVAIARELPTIERTA